MSTKRKLSIELLALLVGVYDEIKAISSFNKVEVEVEDELAKIDNALCKVEE